MMQVDTFDYWKFFRLGQEARHLDEAVAAGLACKTMCVDISEADTPAKQNAVYDGYKRPEFKVAA